MTTAVAAGTGAERAAARVQREGWQHWVHSGKGGGIKRDGGDCNEYGTIYAISSDFGDRMTIQHLD